MRIDIISVQPELLRSFMEYSIVSRARKASLVEIFLHDLHKYGNGKYNQIDDYQYGGGAGMVLMVEPIHKCIEQLKNERAYDEVIYMTPDGLPLQQSTINTLSLLENIIIICGHYKGVDQRVRDLFVTREISIGNYVLSGGEIPAAVLTDGLIRLLPGVLGDETSALTDSFQDGLLSPPIYTRPESYLGCNVPSVLLSGNFNKIEDWKLKQSRDLNKRKNNK